MKTFRIAAIVIVLLALTEAAWWASKNHAQRASTTPPQLQSPTASKAAVTPVAVRQGAAPPAINGTSPTPMNASGSSATSGDSEQRLGPFALSGSEYTVVLKKNKRQPGSTQETGDTVTAMEIHDSGGSVLYQKVFPYQPTDNANDNEFSDAWSVSAAILQGTNDAGLMVTYDLNSEPSAPEPEPSGWYQVFGVVDGKFKAFSGPILVQGDLIQDNNSSKIYKTVGPLDAHSDALNFKVWAHHFRLIYPVRIDWSEAKVLPALSCGKADSGQACRYSVLPESERRAGELTFVQLCPDAPACDHPERVVVKSNSNVELLSCAADVKWEAGKNSAATGSNPMEDQGGISVGTENLHLLVRIDGKQGWIHSDEDFNALGLPFDQ